MSFYQVPLEGVQIVTAEQAALLAGQLDSQPAVLQINNPPIAPVNVDQSYYVSLNGELYYPVAASDISGQVAVVPLDQQMDWVAVPVAQQQFAIQQLQPEVQVQSFPSSSTFGMVPTTSETSSVPIRQKKRQIRRPKTSKSKKALFETFETSSTPSPTLDNASPSSVRVISEGSVSPVVPGKSLDKPRRRRKKLKHEKVPRRMRRDYDELLSNHELLREFRKTMPKPCVKLTKRFKRQLLSDRYKKPVEEVMSESSEEDPGKYDEFFDRLEMLGENADSVQEDGSDVWEPKDAERDVQREESVQILSDDEEDEIAVETVHAPESPKRMRSISESPKEPSAAEDEEEPEEEHSDEEKIEQKRNASGDDDEEREGSDFFDDEEEQQFLEYFTNLVASLEHDPMISFPKRLWDSKPIMSVVESMPKLSYDLFYDLMNSVLIPIVRVIPNAIINGVGPVVHECGSLLNFLINENVTAPERVWFHYSLSIMLGDRKNRKLEYLTDEELAGIMKSLKEELEKTGTFKNAVGRNQRMSKKLVLEMTTANAKVTLLFCTPIALKRSYLIRSYRRVDDRLQQLAYLFTILTQTNPDLALLTNSPLCHLLIFYLQVYGYIDVLHEKIPEDVIEVDIFSLVDIPDERLLGCRNNELADIPVSLMLYECAEFYARFNYEYAIDIAVNEAKKRRTYHDYRRYSKDPIFIPCAYSDCNIASGITRKCFGSFMKMMENIMDKFMKGKEAELFENNLLELAKSGGNVPFV